MKLDTHENLFAKSKHLCLIKFSKMIHYQQITRQIERKAVKYIISRHKEFAHLSILDKEHLIVEAKNKLEDITLFANLFFIISTSMLILKLLIV